MMYTDTNGNLDLDEVYEEIEYLYRTFALEEDEKMTKEARRLKTEVRTFLKKIQKLKTK